MNSFTDHTHVIIGGTSKAGTTSLFLYLAEHPMLCGANSKETGFFLDDSYPRRTKYRLQDGVDHYDTYFNLCADLPYYVDATPDYLYSEDAALRIRSTLPNAKLIFVLRDPVDRLVSWYRFARQLGRIAQDLSFEDYIAQQHAELPIQPGEQSYMRALQHGRYYRYLQPYFDCFSPDDIFVGSYETLKHNAPQLMLDLSTFLGIDPAFYSDYDYTVHNRTQTMRFVVLNRAYVQARDKMRMHLNTIPIAKKSMRPLRQGFETVFFRANAAEEDTLTISPELSKWLRDYYAESAVELGHLLGSDSLTWI